MNLVVLIGRLTKDPELKDINGKAKLNFTLAVDRPPDGVDFIDCVTWLNNAEVIAKWTKKGHMLAVWGRLRKSTWTDKDDKKQSRTEVDVKGFQFLESKKKDETDDFDLPF